VNDLPFDVKYPATSVIVSKINEKQHSHMKKGIKHHKKE